MASAPSSRQSSGPGRSAAGNRADIRALSNCEPPMPAGWGPDSPAERQVPLSRSPRAYLANGASGPRRTPRGICSARPNRDLTMLVCAPDGTGALSRSPRAYLANDASAPRRTPRGICSPFSNRELLGLEILQLVENKHHRPVLIANFEPFCAQQKHPIP